MAFVCDSIFKENFLDQFIVLIMKLLHYKNKLIRNKMSKILFSRDEILHFYHEVDKEEKKCTYYKSCSGCNWWNKIDEELWRKGFFDMNKKVEEWIITEL